MPLPEEDGVGQKLEGLSERDDDTRCSLRASMLGDVAVQVYRDDGMPLVGGGKFRIFVFKREDLAAPAMFSQVGISCLATESVRVDE